MISHRLTTSSTLQLLRFSSNVAKIDLKTLQELDNVDDEKILEQLDKYLTSYGDRYRCAEDLKMDIDHLQRSYGNQKLVDQNLREFTDKLHVFEMVFTFCDAETIALIPSSVDDFLRSFVHLALINRFIKQLDGTFELVPIDKIVTVKETFRRFLKKEPKFQWAPPAKTIEKVYERFSELYDENLDQETLVKLKSYLKSIGTTRTAKKHPNWYAKAFKEHFHMMTAIRDTMNAHPMIFKPSAENTPLDEQLPPAIRVFNDGNFKFVFQEDVESIINSAVTRKDEKRTEKPRKEFHLTMPFEKFEKLLKYAGMKTENVSLIQQPSPQRIGTVGSYLKSSTGKYLKSTAHVIDELLVELIYSQQVWSRLEMKMCKVEQFELKLAEILRKILEPDAHSFMETDAAGKFICDVTNHIQPFLEKPRQQMNGIRIEPSTGFTVTDLRTEIVENLNLAAFYPEIVDFIAPVYEKMLTMGNRAKDALKQTDLILAVAKCLGEVIRRKFKFPKGNVQLETSEGPEPTPNTKNKKKNKKGKSSTMSQGSPDRLKEGMSLGVKNFILNKEWLDYHEKLEAMKLLEKKWQQEKVAMQKTLKEKEKTIGGLEDKIQNFQEQLNRVEEGRKADLAKKNVEIQKWKDEVDKLEQTYRRKIEKAEELQVKLDKVERESKDSAKSSDDSEIQESTPEKFSSKTRDLNRRVPPSVSTDPGPSNANANANVQPNIPTRNGFQNLTMNEPAERKRRTRGVQKKFEQFEAMMERLESEMLLRKAIVTLGDFCAKCKDPKMEETARRSLEIYRQKYYDFLNPLKTNIRVMSENLGVKLDELKAVPAFPDPFILNFPAPNRGSARVSPTVIAPAPTETFTDSSSEYDDRCPICLCKMSLSDPKTKCEGCRHEYHADCVSAWLKINATCPNCRRPLTDPKEFPPLR